MSFAGEIYIFMEWSHFFDFFFFFLVVILKLSPGRGLKQQAVAAERWQLGWLSLKVDMSGLYANALAPRQSSAGTERLGTATWKRSCQFIRCAGLWALLFSGTRQYFYLICILSPLLKPQFASKQAHEFLLYAEAHCEVSQEAKIMLPNSILPPKGKSWESKQAECKVNTIIQKLCVGSAPDQLWDWLSARRVDGGSLLKSWNTQKS